MTRLMDRTMLDPETFCLLWTGAVKSNGYGNVVIDGQTLGAHRAAWQESHGAIPDGLCVLHRCDVRRCINPHHLFLGTKQDNSRDMVAKGRYRGPRKLTQAQRSAVRGAVANGETQRAVADRFAVSQATVSNIVRGVHR